MRRYEDYYEWLLKQKGVPEEEIIMITQEIKQVAKETFTSTLESFKTGPMLAWDQKDELIKSNVSKELKAKFPVESADIEVVPYTVQDANYGHTYKLNLKLIDSIE